MVFDVESVGLHGEGFDVGYVVVNRSGETIAEKRISCDPGLARGSVKSREWVAEHVPQPQGHVFESPRGVREQFWGAWLLYHARGAALVSDCGWPVEARFLAACIDDDPERREWDGPYPLHELASILLAAGMDPLAKRDRLPGELPEHDPLADARQSARLLAVALKALEK